MHTPYDEEAGSELWETILDVCEADWTEWAEGDGDAVEMWDVYLGE